MSLDCMHSGANAVQKHKRKKKEFGSRGGADMREGRDVHMSLDCMQLGADVVQK